MSFRFSDLKKSVRKTKEGHRVAPVRLEGRPSSFKIEFLLQQFEGHLGCPRRLLDPHTLLDFVGDARLGRGLLTTMAQWYRVRARAFAEVLPDAGAGLRERGITGPVDLRAWLYAAVNRTGRGYLEPKTEAVFWSAQSRALGERQETLRKLMLLDRPEEAVLVRTGPAPTTADVIATYNARAHTTLLRSAAEVTLRCGAARGALERATQVWAQPLGVEWRVEGDAVRLLGQADALGCWTRRGRHVERVALELMANPEIAVRELEGQVEVGERRCRFRWTADTLALLGAGRGGSAGDAPAEQVAALASLLRRERDRAQERSWSIRRASHLVGVDGGIFLPHLEFRAGDLALYLRLTESTDDASRLAPFRHKTPVALVSWSGVESAPLALRFPDELAETCPSDAVLARLSARLDSIRQNSGPVAAIGAERSLRPAA
jgi:hypothetical protein